MKTAMEHITEMLSVEPKSVEEVAYTLFTIKGSEGDRFRSVQNLRGFVSSVVKAAKDEKGQKLFEFVGQGKYRVRTQKMHCS